MSALARSSLVESSKRPCDDSKRFQVPGLRDSVIGWIGGLQLPRAGLVGSAAGGGDFVVHNGHHDIVRLRWRIGLVRKEVAV